MTFQAYLDTIRAKTGKTPEDFRALAAKKGLTKYPEVLAWLKADFGLGHGHANAIAQLLVNAEKLTASPDDKLAAHFKGEKAHWREVFADLTAKLSAFGPDFKTAPTSSYLSLLRGEKKFGVLQISTPERLDLGLKLKGVPPSGRLEAAGTWNNLVTHRVRISDPAQIDAELFTWLQQAYAAAA